MAVTIDTDKCLACGCCSDVCPEGALELHETAVVYDDYCIDCGSCVTMCPSEAICE